MGKKIQGSGLSELNRAAIQRLDDAKQLLEAQRWRGAMYLGGYAVECRLKTSLMKRFDCVTLDRLEVELVRRKLMSDAATVFSHRLGHLLQLTGSKDRMMGNVSVWRRFIFVNTWVPAWRYSGAVTLPTEAQAFMDAILSVNLWIENNV